MHLQSIILLFYIYSAVLSSADISCLACPIKSPHYYSSVVNYTCCMRHLCICKVSFFSFISIQLFSSRLTSSCLAARSHLHITFRPPLFYIIARKETKKGTGKSDLTSFSSKVLLFDLLHCLTSSRERRPTQRWIWPDLLFFKWFCFLTSSIVWHHREKGGGFLTAIWLF